MRDRFYCVAVPMLALDALAIAVIAAVAWIGPERPPAPLLALPPAVIRGPVSHRFPPPIAVGAAVIASPPLAALDGFPVVTE